jgi:hypothetical protein
MLKVSGPSIAISLQARTINFHQFQFNTLAKQNRGSELNPIRFAHCNEIAIDGTKNDYMDSIMELGANE